MEYTLLVCIGMLGFDCFLMIMIDNADLPRPPARQRMEMAAGWGMICVPLLLLLDML